MCAGLVTSCNYRRRRGVAAFSTRSSACAVSDPAAKSLRLCQKCIPKKSAKIFLTLDVLIHFLEQTIAWVEHISTLFSIRLGNQIGKKNPLMHKYIFLPILFCFFVLFEQRIFQYISLKHITHNLLFQYVV